MAQKTLISITSDLSGERDAITVRFGYEGYDYEIDLTEAEHEKLGAFLSPFITAGRRAGRAGGSRRASPQTIKKSPQNRTAVREWARANGYEISERGRIPAHVQEKFDAR